MQPIANSTCIVGILIPSPPTITLCILWDGASSRDCSWIIVLLLSALLMQFLIIAAAGCYHPTCWPGCSQSMLPMPFGGQSLTCALKTCALTPTCALNAKQILHLRAYRANNQASLHKYIHWLQMNHPLERIDSLESNQPPPWNQYIHRYQVNHLPGTNGQLYWTNRLPGTSCTVVVLQ